jgi:hypothetical protein
MALSTAARDAWRWAGTAWCKYNNSVWVPRLTLGGAAVGSTAGAALVWHVPPSDAGVVETTLVACAGAWFGGILGATCTPMVPMLLPLTSILLVPVAAGYGVRHLCEHLSTSQTSAVNKPEL